MKSLPDVNSLELFALSASRYHENIRREKEEKAPLRLYGYWENPSELCTRHYPIARLVRDCVPDLLGRGSKELLQSMTDSAIVAIQSKELRGIAEAPYSTTFIEYVLWLSKRTQFVPTVWARDLVEVLAELWEKHNQPNVPNSNITRESLAQRREAAERAAKALQPKKRGRAFRWDERTTKAIFGLWGTGWGSVEKFVEENRSELPTVVTDYSLGPEVAVRRILDAGRRRRINAPQP